MHAYKAMESNMDDAEKRKKITLGTGSYGRKESESTKVRVDGGPTSGLDAHNGVMVIG
jgi:hypothetical protein